MGSHRIVVDPPAFDDPPVLGERSDDMRVEAFIPQLPFVGFHERVLNRLACRDVPGEVADEVENAVANEPART